MTVGIIMEAESYTMSADIYTSVLQPGVHIREEESASEDDKDTVS